MRKSQTVPLLSAGPFPRPPSSECPSNSVFSPRLRRDDRQGWSAWNQTRSDPPPPPPPPPMYRSLPRSVREAYCSESKQLGCCGLLYHLTGTHSFALVFRSGKKSSFLLLFLFLFLLFFFRQLQCFAGDTFHVAIRGPSPLDFGRRWMVATIPNSVSLSPSLGGFLRSQSVFFFFFFF